MPLQNFIDHVIDKDNLIMVYITFYSKNYSDKNYEMFIDAL